MGSTPEEYFCYRLKSTTKLEKIYSKSLTVTCQETTHRLHFADKEERNQLLRLLQGKALDLKAGCLPLFGQLQSHGLLEITYTDNQGLTLQIYPMGSCLIPSPFSTYQLESEDEILTGLIHFDANQGTLMVTLECKSQLRTEKAESFFAALRNKTSRPVLMSILRELKILQSKSSEVTWAGHDLFFHNQTRYAWSPSRELYHAKGVLPPPPTLPQALQRIPIKERIHTKKSFTEVLMSRRSQRQHSIDRAISQEEILGLCAYLLPERKKFLFPCAGGLDVTKVYIYLHKSSDLEQGLYLLSTAQSTLNLISKGQMPQAIRTATEVWSKNNEAPHAIIFIAGNYPRMFSQYKRLAYRNLLIQAGCIAYLIELASAALGLKTCLLGAGGSLELSRLTGVSASEECQLLEIALGV
jgi:SagB-type dehydrogenase family enzyme